MASFRVTYGDGKHDDFVADEYGESGSWLVFSTGGIELVRVRSESVRCLAAMPPAKELKSWCRWGGTALLAVIAMGALGVGVLDVFGAETTSGRAFGAVLAAAGALCAWGAVGMAAAGSDGPRRALVGSIAAAALCLAIVVVQLGGAGHRPLLTAGLILAAVLAAVVSVALWKVKARPRIPSPLRGFLAASVLVGLFQFWYDKEYLPVSGDAGLTESVELAASPTPDGRLRPEFVTATLTLKNISNTRLRIMGSFHTLWTFDPGRSEVTYITGQPSSFGDGNWLSPGQDYVEKVVLRIPDDAGPAVSLDYEVYVTKGSRLPHGRRHRCPEDDCPVAWRIGESSLVNRITREPRYVVRLPYVRPVLTSMGMQPRQTGLTTCISHVPESCPSARLVRLDNIYGRVRIAATTQLVFETKSSESTPRSP